MAIDKEIDMRVKVAWARILVKVKGKARPTVVHILEWGRSFELQIWWEIPPKSTKSLPIKCQKNPAAKGEGGRG